MPTYDWTLDVTCASWHDPPSAKSYLAFAERISLHRDSAINLEVFGRCLLLGAQRFFSASHSSTRRGEGRYRERDEDKPFRRPALGERPAARVRVARGARATTNRLAPE